MPTEEKRPRLYLIDAMSYIFRAYHAPMKERLASPQGVPTQAVYFFANMLRKLIREHAPDYLAVVFESKGPTFRDALYADYKAERPPTPDDLVLQLPYIRRLCQALRIPILEYEGYEADDVIGTLTSQAAQAGLAAVVVSSDKDMLQLVRDAVRVFSPTREKFFDAPEVEDYFGVPPEKVVDVVALMGDAIDNIPGAKGIGQKGARSLIRQYGSLEAALAHFAEVKQKNYREALRDQREQILLSKKLAAIHTDVPVPLDPERLRRTEPDPEALRSLFAELGFTSLLKEVLQAQGESPAATAAPARLDYQELKTHEELKDFLALARPLALWCETEGVPPLDLKLTALAFSPQPGQACWIRLGDGRAAVLAAARSFLEDAAAPKSLHDAKTATLALATAGIELRGVTHDTLLYSYLLQPTTAKHALADAALRHLNLAVSGAVPEKADFVARLAAKLRPQIEAQELIRVYETIELPLVPVLAEMERAGILVDRSALHEMAMAFEDELGELTASIYQLAGVEFNLNSPKQLAEILFEKLNLPMPRRHGRGKVASTAADVLEELAAGHELPARVLAYRELAKLKSTYIDVLPGRIHPRTARLHTSFNQAGTATGRLSSAEPNLQNIPIRTHLGNKIRAAFLAPPGWRLLSADYSQIELRVLAHMSEDPVLLDAFHRGEDVHARTAQEVLGVPPLLQTAEHRRIAKMINFGIIYGLTAFGLATRLGIESAAAQKLIDAYFRRYAGVRAFRERLLAQTRQSGLTRTLFGRSRPIPEINARNPNQRNYAERTALNSPLQGTAADLMKLAMIAVADRLRRASLRTRMLLQVHDELLFEVPEDECERAKEIIQPAMEQVYPLLVPLGVKLSSGPNWRDLK
ncbi:MAG: DNA polymerase I [Terriglobia bacterium]